VADALHSLKGSPAVPDTGSLRGDLEAVARRSGSTANRFDARLMMGLITAVARDDELRRVVRERFLDPGQAGFRAVFERAVARGEMAPGRNLDLLVSLFSALLVQHLLTYGEMPETQFAEQVMHDVILPLATAATNNPPT
jgi:hypothetical protein